jgi:hypothetical protein
LTRVIRTGIFRGSIHSLKPIEILAVEKEAEFFCEDLSHKTETRHGYGPCRRTVELCSRLHSCIRVCPERRSPGHMPRTNPGVCALGRPSSYAPNPGAQRGDFWRGGGDVGLTVGWFFFVSLMPVFYLQVCMKEKKMLFFSRSKQKNTKKTEDQFRQDRSLLCYHSLRHKSCSTVFGCKKDLCHESIGRPLEKTRSNAALVAGMAKKV